MQSAMLEEVVKRPLALMWLPPQAQRKLRNRANLLVKSQILNPRSLHQGSGLGPRCENTMWR